MEQYKLSEWVTPSGSMYVNSVQNLAAKTSEWWYPARVLGISLTDFATLLRDTYKANVILEEGPRGTCMFYHWDKPNHYLGHKFLLYVNKVAREKKIKV